MGFAFAILIAGGIALPVFYFYSRLAEDQESNPLIVKELLRWAVKGMGVPLLLWLLMNMGIVPGFPILLGAVAAAKGTGGDWLFLLFQYSIGLVLIIASYWAGLSMIWLLWRYQQSAQDRTEFWSTAGLWAALALPFAAFCGYSGRLYGAGMTVVIWLSPILFTTAPLIQRKKVMPSYSRAVTLMKFGKYNEAEWEVIHELEKAEDDFDGWLMLAQLYAEHFHDLISAEQTIYDVCSQAATTPPQASVAINKLADWHLKIGEDPAAARQVLEVICQKWPGSHLDKMARLRIAQLPADRDALLASRQPRRIRLPALRDVAEVEPASACTPNLKEIVTAKAKRLVAQLNEDPNDAKAREELARILAEELQQAEMGIEQMELLLGMPNQEDNARAEWLASIAAWQFRLRRDPEKGRETLQRLLQEHPQSVQAFTAQRRLNLMQLEERMKQRRAEKGNAPKITIEAPARENKIEA